MQASPMHTCGRTHTPGDSFAGVQGQVPRFSNFKTRPPPEVRVPHTASGVERVWLAALFLASGCLRKDSCIWQLIVS